MPKIPKKIYVGCAINNLTPEQKQLLFKVVVQVKNELRSHFEVLEFLGTATGSPKDTYVRDIIECVNEADCMLAVCNHASTGLGYELAVAIEKRGIPVLAVAHHQSSVSRLIEGIDQPNYHFMRYVRPSDIYKKTIEVMKGYGVL